MTNADNKQYCEEIVRERHPDTFLASLFVPSSHRDLFMAVYALDAELDKVRDSVSEELLAHVRFAWWEESLQELFDGKPARGHPVLESLAPVIHSGKLPQMSVDPLTECYRNHYPSAPPERSRYMDAISQILLRAYYAPAEKSWKKAMRIIGRHRRTYGQRLNGWLQFKLLLSGVF